MTTHVRNPTYVNEFKQVPSTNLLTEFVEDRSTMFSTPTISIPVDTDENPQPFDQVTSRSTLLTLECGANNASRLSWAMHHVFKDYPVLYALLEQPTPF